MSWWKNRHGFAIERDWMVFCTGVVPAISSIVRKLTTVGENVVVMTPVYNIFFNSIINNGRKVLESKLIYKDGEYSIDYDDLNSNDIVKPGLGYIPFASVSDVCRDNSITCVSPTKAFNIAGIQTAAVIVPNRNIRAKVDRGLNTDEVAEPNVFAQIAPIAAFGKGGSWLDELNAYLSDGRAYRNGEGFLRMNLACPRALLEDGLNRLKESMTGKEVC